MATLEELRAQLDGIDNEIIELYKKRMDVCMEIGDIKISEGNKVFDKQREREKLAAVAAKVTEEFHKKGVQELFEQLMSLSRKLQYQLLTKRGALGRLPFIGVDKLDWENSRIVFQGTEGAYSQAAMEMYFGKDTNSFHVQTFRDAMEAIEEGSADFAVLPIENSSAGAVNEVYDLLVEFENYIVGEVVLPINHTLSGVKGTTLDQIERVYSHPQALMQSAKFWTHTETGSRSAWQILLLPQKKYWKIKIRERLQFAANMQRVCMDWKFWRRRSIIMIIIPRVLLS